MAVDRDKLHTLSALLTERTGGLGGGQDLSRQAGMSPQTLRKIRKLADEWKQTEPTPEDVAHSCNRKLRDSIARLAIVCNELPEAWLEAFGVEQTAARGMARAVKKRGRGPLRRGSAAGPDLVTRIEQFAANGPDSAEPCIRVGLLHWEPFTTLALPGWPVERRAAAEPPAAFEASLAAWWVRKAVGAVAPEIRNLQFVKVDRVDRLLRGLGVRGGDREWDIAVGLFDLPQRRRTDVWFSSIPGFRVKVGALFFSPTADPSVPPWEAIASPDRTKPDALYHVVTVREEASWVFLRGATQYPLDRIYEARSLEIGEVLQSCAELAARLRSEPEEAARSFVLVSDEETVLRVERAFRHVKAKCARVKPDGFPLTIDPPDRDGSPLTVSQEMAEFAGYEARELPDEHDTRPRYDATMCFARGEERLYRLVRYAKLEELFGTGLDDTARLLADFFAEAARVSGAAALHNEVNRVIWRQPLARPRSIWSPAGFGAYYLNKTGLQAAFSKHLEHRLVEIVRENPEFRNWTVQRETRAARGGGYAHPDQQALAIARQIAKWMLPEPWSSDLSKKHGGGAGR